MWILREIKGDTGQISKQAKDINVELDHQGRKIDKMDKQLDNIHSINTRNHKIADGKLILFILFYFILFLFYFILFLF